MKSGSFYVTMIEVKYFVIVKACLSLMLATDADANLIIFIDASVEVIVLETSPS